MPSILTRILMPLRDEPAQGVEHGHGDVTPAEEVVVSGQGAAALRPARRRLPRDVIKTLTYLCIHLTVGFSVAWALTGSVAIAGGIALIEPCINAVAFYFHEQAWKRVPE